MNRRVMFKYIISLIDMGITGILMYIMYWFLPEKIWIISERVDQAQDNGIAFFEYLNSCHPEIKSYYLLDKDNKNIAAVEQIGNVLVKGSLKHKLYFLKSQVIATTEKNIIEPWGSNIFYKYFAKYYPTKMRVFLQHGISDKDVSSVYGKQVSNFDLFVTASSLEKNFVIDKFGYFKEEVANVGLSRYDKLVGDIQGDSNENIILYMPTWRRYLIDLAIDNEVYREEVKQNFIQSDYYQQINAFINSTRLENILEGHNYKVIMVTHHAINSLKEMFKSECKNIEIYRSEDVNIKELLKKAKIFITDYSSIHFDSAYIGNINIYYQFDKAQFREEHAGSSYFSYSDNGFGEVVETLPELLEELKVNIEQDRKRADLYTQRVDDFFEFKDGKNCERLYQAIQEKLDKNYRKKG